MMPILSIGKTDIPYRITRSTSAYKKRIVVTPNDVEIIAPLSNNDNEIAAFIHKKRKWVYEKREVMHEWLTLFENDEYIKLQSGARIPYRGRNIRITIKKGNCSSISIEYKQLFIITLPSRVADKDIEKLCAMTINFWLKDKIKQDVRELVRHYSQKLGVKQKGIQVATLKNMWGNCTLKGVIKINWHLIAAPKAVLEYVVLHELCHLKYRNHSETFWKLVYSQMPGYKKAQQWLDQHVPHYKL